jgi:hypothetical protein
LEVLAQQLPGREMERHAAVEIFIAQHPADAARPRQHAKGRRIGNDGEIGRARHLVEAHSAAARERCEGAGIGGIERGGRDIDVVAGLERGAENRHRHRLGTRGAVRIGPNEAHKLKIVLLDPALEIVGLPSLLVGPQTVSCDEWERLFHLLLPCDAAGGRNVDDGAAPIQIVHGARCTVRAIDGRMCCRFDRPVAAHSA